MTMTDDRVDRWEEVPLPLIVSAYVRTQAETIGREHAEKGLSTTELINAVNDARVMSTLLPDEQKAFLVLAGDAYFDAKGQL